MNETLRSTRWIALAAGVWSLLFGLAGVFWALGGAGFPFGVGDPRAESMGSFLAAAQPGATGLLFAVLGLLGAAIAVAMTRSGGAPLSSAFAVAMSVGLILVIPDTRVVQNFAYLFLGYTGLWDGPLLFMLFSIVGGVLWGAAVWFSRGRDAEAPRWGRPVTYAAAALALPYGISRVAWALGIPLGVPAGPLTDGSAGDAAADATGSSIVWLSEWVLGGLCFAGAILTLGLIQRWGEIFPRWIPYLRGRRVPIWFAVVPALAAAAMMTQAGVRTAIWIARGEVSLTAENWGGAGPTLVWLPWGVTLALATYAYYLRRTATDRPADHLGVVTAPTAEGPKAAG